MIGTDQPDTTTAMRGACRRSPALTLLVVFAAALHAACGASSPDAGRTTVSFWHHQTVAEGPTLIQQAVDRFTAAHPGVDVEVVPINNDAYKTKIKVAIGAGQAPCVFPSWGGGTLREYVKAGQIIDLTPYMTRENYRDRFLDAAFTQITVDGRIYGVPVENTSLAVVLFNRALFNQWTIAIPRTYGELLGVVRTLKAHGVAPFALANKPKWPGSMFFMYLVDRLAGPEPFARAAAREGTFEDPVFVEAGRRIQELVRAGAFQEGFNGLDFDPGGTRALLYSGKAAMELMGTWQVSAIKGENPEFYEKNLDFFPFPAIEGGTGDPRNIVGTIGDNFYSISASCAHPDEAFALIQTLIDDTSVEARARAGRVPPVKGFTTEDPVLRKILTLVQEAPHVQLWYDQYLPPAVAEVHKDTSQGLFALTTTPEEAAAALERAARSQQD